MWLLASRISRIMSRKISAPRAAALDAAIVRAHLQVAVEEFSGCILTVEIKRPIRQMSYPVPASAVSCGVPPKERAASAGRRRT